MQEVSQVSGELNDRTVGRWPVALAATVALMVWGGYLESVGSAYAGGKPEENVGSPGRAGQDTTCFVYRPSHDPSLGCNADGEDGEAGAPGAVYR